MTFIARDPETSAVVWIAGFLAEFREQRVIDHERAAQACRDRGYICVACGADLRLEPKRDRAKAFFGHPSRSNCSHASEPLLSHDLLRVQQRIYSLLHHAHHQHADVRLDIQPGNQTGKGSARVLIEPHDGSRGLWIEIQRSKMSASDVTERERLSAAAGHGLEWVFVFGDGQDWKADVKIAPSVQHVLDQRGYALVLEDPLADNPHIKVLAHRSLTGARQQRKPQTSATASVLNDRWRVAEFRATPNGLLDPKLNPYLASLIASYQEWLDHHQPPAPASDTASDTWQPEHDRLTWELANADHAAITAAQAATDATSNTSRISEQIQELERSLNQLGDSWPQRLVNKRARRGLQDDLNHATASLQLAQRTQEQAHAAATDARDHATARRQELHQAAVRHDQARQQDQQAHDRQRESWRAGRQRAAQWLEKLPLTPANW